MKIIKHVRTEMGKWCPSARLRGNAQSKHELRITTTVSQAEWWLIVVIWPGNHHDVWAAVISTMSPHPDRHLPQPAVVLGIRLQHGRQPSLVGRQCKSVGRRAGPSWASDETTWSRQVLHVVDGGLCPCRHPGEQPIDQVWVRRGAIPKVVRIDRLIHVP
jgi:hypothetical protein